ncbi:hypothetical protein ACUXVT_06025 [Acinetobacter soli]|uniref:hypothetical protein n=1 Tax=Acinetobacter soli TaxID=487316 RepID=UPI00405686FD
MISTSRTAIDTIGNESFYVLEKTGSAIFDNDNAYLQIALSLLKEYKIKLGNLKIRIDENPVYDRKQFDYEFETLFYALDRLYNLLGNTQTKEKQLEATIFHSYICSQDNRLRSLIEDSEK